MRRFLIHLAVALVAFIVGMTTAAIFGAASGPRERRVCSKSVYYAPPPPPVSLHSCPDGLRHGDLPAPPESVAPAAAPAAPESFKETRLIIRSADGTVQVIKQRGEAKAARQF